MRSARGLLTGLTALSLLSIKLVSADDCQPWIWKRAVGDIICRYDTTTGADVNYYTCKALADRYQTTVEEFFFLNPAVDKDCRNIQPNTTYCVDGYLEPLLAVDGKCGPPNNNATCIGTEKQCCNSETWTCGDTAEDCAPGTCYEGVCPGADLYSISGQCGPKNDNLLCGGKWGDCCNFDGVCGTGADFCGKGVCESGNCTSPDPGSLPVPVPSGGSESSTSTRGLPWQTGTTPDGSCGGDNGYTCDVVFGACCHADGTCGSGEGDCGEGCQTKYGKCSDGTDVVFFPDFGKF